MPIIWKPFGFADARLWFVRCCKILENSPFFGVIAPEFLYRSKAREHGVRYIGLNRKHRIALFQDPVTGSSFGVKRGERFETGIRRVRERFGMGFPG